VLAVVMIAVGLIAAAARLSPPAPLPVVSTIDVPDAANSVYEMELSPDARWLAYIGNHNRSRQDSIWVRSMGSLDTHAIPGTEGLDQLPFWSPDAKSLGFFAGGKLKRVDIATGVVQAIADDAARARGGAWGRNGVIIFTPNGSAPLFHIDSHGGAPVQLTTLAPGEQSHRLPAFAEDGVHFVFTVMRGNGQSSIRIGSLDRLDTANLVDLTAGFNPPSEATQAYVINGHLLFVRGGVLFAQKLDLRAWRLLEEPVSIATNVGDENLGRQPFTASGGLIVYRRELPGTRFRQMVWVQRNGSHPQTVWKPGDFNSVRLAPDGYRIACSLTNPDMREADVWIIDSRDDGALRLTEGLFADNVVWSGDGSRVFYAVYKGLSSQDIYSKRADGSGTAALVLDVPPTPKRPYGWSSDGRLLFYFDDAVAGQLEIRDVDVNTRQATVVRDNMVNLANSDLPPGGRFIAYARRSGDASEVYVEPLRGGSPVRVSTNGGRLPRWKADGSELYYVSNGQLTAAEVRYNGDTAIIGDTRPLFLFPPDATGYLPSPDGQRFLLLRRTTTVPDVLPPTVIVNWTSLLKRP